MGGITALGASWLPPISASRSPGKMLASEGFGVGVLLATASPFGQRKSPFPTMRQEGSFLLETPSLKSPPWPWVRGDSQKVAVGQQWWGESSRVRHMGEYRAELGIFANPEQLSVSQKSQPRMSNLLGKQKCCKGCVGKISPCYSSQKHCSAIAGGPAPVHSPGNAPRDSPVPSHTGLDATTEAATLTRLPCYQAGKRSETLTKPGHHYVCSTGLKGVTPQGTGLRALSSPAAVQVSKTPLPKTAEII